MTGLLKKASDYCGKNSHITVRGRGVFGTTVKHIISTDNAKKAAKAALSVEARIKQQA
ncbi:MAG: hypothetical protein RPR91_10665 [Colwellia sp.]